MAPRSGFEDNRHKDSSASSSKRSMYPLQLSDWLARVRVKRRIIMLHVCGQKRP
jgi:hypothetical protein